MISVLSGTYRSDNLTIKFAELYCTLLKLKHQENQLLDFRTLPVSFLHENSIFGQSSEAVNNLLKTYIATPDKYVFVAPEYNGSYPGILKALIDICDPAWFRGKKAALVGISSGRGGNARGMEHLTTVLHYLDVEVLPLKVPISRIHTLFDAEKNMHDEETLGILHRQIDKFINY